jgi:hypothetical protein
MIARAEAIGFVLDVYRTLSLQHDLSPDNEIVTRTLTNFIAFLKAEFEREWAHDLPSDPELAEAAENLPRLCGLAEAEMEKWWARRLLADAGLSFASLDAFWYCENYRHLVGAELPLLNAEGNTRVILLGSGALPLTAILLAKSAPELSIRCVDRDPEANAEDYSFHEDDRVICASLLSAPGIFGILLARHVNAVVLRHAVGLFRFCYRQAPEPPSAYSMAGETLASPRTINVSRWYRLSRICSKAHPEEARV